MEAHPQGSNRITTSVITSFSSGDHFTARHEHTLNLLHMFNTIEMPYSTTTLIPILFDVQVVDMSGYTPPGILTAMSE
jgi:hypothetical protein